MQKFYRAAILTTSLALTSCTPRYYKVGETKVSREAVDNVLKNLGYTANKIVSHYDSDKNGILTEKESREMISELEPAINIILFTQGPRNSRLQQTPLEKVLHYWETLKDLHEQTLFRDSNKETQKL